MWEKDGVRRSLPRVRKLLKQWHPSLPVPIMRHKLILSLLAALMMASIAHAASRDEQTKACKADAIHFCASDIPNKQKITACMKTHYDELSPGCKTMFHKPADAGPKQPVNR